MYLFHPFPAQRLNNRHFVLFSFRPSFQLHWTFCTMRILMYWPLTLLPTSFCYTSEENKMKKFMIHTLCSSTLSTLLSPHYFPDVIRVCDLLLCVWWMDAYNNGIASVRIHSERKLRMLFLAHSFWNHSWRGSTVLYLRFTEDSCKIEHVATLHIHDMKYGHLYSFSKSVVINQNINRYRLTWLSFFITKFFQRVRLIKDRLRIGLTVADTKNFAWKIKPSLLGHLSWSSMNPVVRWSSARGHLSAIRDDLSVRGHLSARAHHMVVHASAAQLTSGRNTTPFKAKKFDIYEYEMK